MTATEHARAAAGLLGGHTDATGVKWDPSTSQVERAQAHALTAIALTMTSGAVPIVGEVTAFTAKL